MKTWHWMVLILGLSGVVLFFPIPLGGDFTCLFHRLFMSESRHVAGDLVEYYVHHFGLFWWGSLFAAAAFIYFIRKQKRV